MIECVKFKSHASGSLLGFADLWIPKMGLEIRGCTLHQKNGKRWLSLPSKEYIDEKNEKKYAPVAKFRDKSIQEAFSHQAIEAIEEFAKQTAEAPNKNEEPPPF